MSVRTAAAAVIVAATAAGNAANWVVTGAGPYDSYGPLLDNNNSRVEPTYTGPDMVVNRMRIQGTLNKVHPNTLANDSVWRLYAHTGFNPAFSAWPQLTTQTTYNTPLSLDGSLYGLFWIKNYPLYRFECFEAGGNETGLDAQWTNMTFTFYDAAPVVTTGPGTGTVSIDTLGSNFNTSLALYRSNGVLVGQDEDGGGPDGTSRLDFSGLAPGTYYIVATGMGGSFVNDGATAGVTGGDLMVHLNGMHVHSGMLEPGQSMNFQFEVVPEPAALAGVLAGIGLLARRRKPA